MSVYLVLKYLALLCLKPQTAYCLLAELILY